eukprot:scpid79502/ scgid3177/ 
MSEWENLEIPELQLKLKEAATYQERSAIRKVLHKKQLRGGGGKNIGKSAAPSGATVKRRPSRESRSIGVVRDYVRKGSDVTDQDRCSPDIKYTPSGKRDSSNNSSARSTPDLDAGTQSPSENGRSNADVEISQLDAAVEADKPHVEVTEQQDPVQSKTNSAPQEAPQQPEPVERPSAPATQSSASSQGDDLSDFLTESALESAIAKSSDYNQRRELRTQLRKMRVDKRAGRNTRGRASQNSESEGSRDREPAPAAASPSPVPAAPVEPEPEPAESEKPESETAVERKDEEERPDEQPQQQQRQQEENEEQATTPARVDAESIDIVVEDTGSDQDEASRLERESSLDEDKILRKSATAPSNTFSTKAPSLDGDEGVSDFRTVLRRSPSPSMPKANQSKSEAAQLDFRTVLHKTDGGISPKKTLEVGEQKYRSEKGRQEDFRGQLKRKVETKDCSSAAPKRSATARQEDFRGLLKKPEEGGRSPRNSLTPATTPPPPRSESSPQSDDTDPPNKDEDTEVTSTLQAETSPPRKSPAPPPVKSKPKASSRPSPVPPEMREELSEDPIQQSQDGETQGDTSIEAQADDSNEDNATRAVEDEDRDAVEDDEN